MDRSAAFTLLSMVLVGCHDDTTSNGVDSSVDSSVDVPSGIDASDSAPDTSDTSDALTPSDPTPLATSAGKDEDPSLIRAADGTFHLMWYSDRDGTDDLFLKSSKDGRTWSADRNVTADAAHDFYPSLIQAKDGRFHVVWWRGDVGPKGIVGSIWTMSSLDLVTWTKPFALTDSTAFAWVPTIAERVPGELVVTWSTDASGDKDIWTRTSKNGGVDWESPRKITDAAFNDDLPFVVARGDGSLLVAWQRYDVTVKTFEAPFGDASNDLVYATSSDGITWSAPTAITSDPSASASPDVILALFPSKDASGWSAAWASTRAPASIESDILALGLSKAPATASNVRLLTNGKERGYSPRLVPVDASGLYLMVWVSKGGGANLDIWHRFLVP